MFRAITAACVFAFALSLNSATAQQPALAIKSTLHLTPATDGFTGHLELLEDARITPQLDKTMWQSGGPDMALDENDPLLKQFATSPLHPAVLRLRDAKGSIVAEKNLEREQARLEVHQLHPGHRSILVTTDLSAGFGSYSGPLTQILDLSRGEFNFVQARDTHEHREPITLASTLKTAWRLVKAPVSSGLGRDILQVACRPNFAQSKSNRFLITYTRYHWTGSEWITTHTAQPGFWESDQPFPNFTRFPAIPMEAY